MFALPSLHGRFGATCFTKDAVGQNILEITHEYSQLFAIFAIDINHMAWKMISDSYTYNLSGNPQKIYFTNGSITKYVYSASGQKLRMVHYTAVKNITRSIGQHVELTAAQIQSTDSTDYLLGGSLVVKNGKIDRYLFDGGYAKATASGTTDNFAFFYQNKDHLGTVRETVTSTGAMKQRVNYYPFGGQLVDTLKAMVLSPNFQQYKYNGKEFDNMYGLNTYDYGARQHYPVLARWDRIDPLCEKYYNISPYAYCANNPIMLVDPDGRDGLAAIDFDKRTIEISQTFYYNKNSEALTQKGIVSDKEINNFSLGQVTVPSEISLVDINGFSSRTWDVNGWSVSFKCDFIGLDSDEAVNEALKSNPEANALCYDGKMEPNATWDPSSRTISLGDNRGGYGSERGSTLNHEIGHSWGLPHENLMPNSPIYGRENEAGTGIMSYGNNRTIHQYEVEYGVEKILNNIPKNHPTSMKLHIK